ncbi:DEAD/DEAH box helicase family protein [Dehalococcoidia bacterium]|nr:DEAD/DEAH box helicase family protein [Dehalococcoidia bacterium]
MSSAVDNPIINDAFREPTRWWDFPAGQPTLQEGRRPAGYYRRLLRTRARTKGRALAVEEFTELKEVNRIRERVKGWRERGYPGVTRTTRALLHHWQRDERERRLFFCQLEAVETIIWLVEASPAERQGVDMLKDELLHRYACKMATGSGKTVVMAMLIAWSVLNKVQNRQDTRFSDAVLVVCPNLTVKERLQVLFPTNEDNYYDKFDLVPRSLLPALSGGKYIVTNWHAFAPDDEPEPGEKSAKYRKVLRRGKESDSAFCNRVLTDLAGKSNILVLNDEAHHCYRPAPLEENSKQGRLPTMEGLTRKEVVEEWERATRWVQALDRINATRGVNFCMDLSATPYYIKGSGYEEGRPFPWIVSDFGLVDAIESGIVKIPRIPVDDDSGRPIPAYFHIWKWIMEQLPPSERERGKRHAKPESVLQRADGALQMLAGRWKMTLEEYRKQGAPVPPVLIAACQDTGLSELIHEYIAQGKVQHELRNLPNDERTIRIDTKLLEEAESRTEATAVLVMGDGEGGTATGPRLTKEKQAELLREKVATIGKPGKLGEQVRCVVSVGMLNEGWDAHNVTQVFGLRAFDSQLLCEQVMGRGLRRTQYDDLTVPEYVDVYGIPFEVIPVQKGRISTPPEVRMTTLVKALPEREKEYEITFPRVEGYVFDVRYRVTADVAAIPEIELTPSTDPTEVMVKNANGYRMARPDQLGPGDVIVHDRSEFYHSQRLQATMYDMASQITHRLVPERRDGEQVDVKRRLIFPQVLRIVQEYLETRVKRYDLPLEEVGLLRYRQRVIERLQQAVRPDTTAGEQPLLPVIERFRPIGSTRHVLFRTSRVCHGTGKSHISHVVVDTAAWEHTVAFALERLDYIPSYARNDHLDFTIPYEFDGQSHYYIPDFLVRVRCQNDSMLNVILEVKGFESERDRAKEAAAQRWVLAVNHHGEFGKWMLLVCRDPRKLNEMLSGVRLRSS